MIIMSEEESDATTTYPDIESFENNEVEDHENNHDIQITLNLGSPQTQPVAQPEQSNKINNTTTIETSDKVFRLEELYKKQSKSIATLAKAVKSLARQMPATKPKSRKRKRHRSTSRSSSSSSSSDSARSSPEKRRPKKQKRSTNSLEANSGAEAQLLIQQQQTLPFTKQKSPSKDIEGQDFLNHSTGDQSPIGDMLSQIDLEEDVDFQTAPKISENFAKRVEFKWQTRLIMDRSKEESKNLLVPENCPKLSVPLTNKEVFSQFNNPQKKADLRLRNLQKNIQKATIALVQVTDNLLQDKGETKAMIKNNLDAISLMGHSLQDISTMRRQKIEPVPHCVIWNTQTHNNFFGKT